METCKVTVIVAVYNAARYLKRCVNSICLQTYKNLEIILVNDGSTDNSGEICDDFAKNDKRVLVIHQSNKGVSAARNIGINRAHGEYMMFVDADDFLERRMISLLIKHVEDNYLTICGYYIDIEKNEIESSKKMLYEQVNVSKVNKEKVVDVYKKGLLSSVWNKMYLTRIIRNSGLFFLDNLSLGEDALFNLKYITVSNCDFIILNEPLYHYVKRKNESLNQKYRSDFFEIQIKLFESIIDFGNNVRISKDDMNELNCLYFNALVVAIDNLYCNRKKMTSAEYNAKMNCLKNEKIYKRLIKGINGKDKVICFIRYQLIKSGAFVVDWKIREVIKRKLGVE